MVGERNKNIVRRVMAELDARNLEGVTANYAPEARFHGFAPETLDVSGYRGMMSELLEAFPDSRFPVHQIMAEGDRVVCRHSLRGTHLGVFQDVPPSGKTVIVPAIALFRLENDQVAEIWLNADFLGLLRQLGVVPEPI